jgi:hypothetical protein
MAVAADVFIRRYRLLWFVVGAPVLSDGRIRPKALARFPSLAEDSPSVVLRTIRRKQHAEELFELDWPHPGDFQ